jgi:hypothetical protein
MTDSVIKFSETNSDEAREFPFFSVVIPMYNRAREIRRALDSCQSQEFTDYEIIVVDDCSTDDSVRVVESYGDKRIRCVSTERNGGVSNARYVGAQEALGEWVVFLDSDDTLLGHALSTMHQIAIVESSEVDRLLFPYTRSDGRVTELPTQLPIIGYIEWLRLWEQNAIPDLMNCTRRSTFEALPLSTAWGGEVLYNLNFVTRFKSHYISTSVARVYEDASNRLTTKGAQLVNYRFSHSAQAMLCETLASHGDALQTSAPSAYRSLSRLLILEFAKTKSYRSVLCQSLDHLKRFPSDVLPVICAGLGPRVYGAVLSLRLNIDNRRRRCLQTGSLTGAHSATSHSPMSLAAFSEKDSEAANVPVPKR